MKHQRIQLYIGRNTHNVRYYLFKYFFILLEFYWSFTQKYYIIIIYQNMRHQLLGGEKHFIY